MYERRLGGREGVRPPAWKALYPDPRLGGQEGRFGVRHTMSDYIPYYVPYIVSGVSVALVVLYSLTRTSSSPSRSDSPHSRDIGGGVRISALCKEDKLHEEPFGGVKTLYEAFYSGYNMNPDHDCLGARSGEQYHWISYRQLEERVKSFGSALVKECGDNFVGIIGINCIDWVVAQLGCVFYNRVLVPMYDTLGDEAMGHIIQQTDCKVIVSHPDKIAKVANFLQAGPHGVTTVIKMKSEPTEAEKAQFRELGVSLRSVADMIESGSRDVKEPTPPSTTDIYTICYTSGTTGIPKGAVITHENMATTMAGVIATNRDFLLSPGQIHFSYLPLCHLFEMSVHLFVFTSGAAVGYYSGNPLDLPDDIRILQPTVFPAVPRVLNKFRDRIQGIINEKPALVRWLFARGLASKYADLNRGVFEQNMWDKLVFKKIRDAKVRVRPPAWKALYPDPRLGGQEGRFGVSFMSCSGGVSYLTRD
eukprot:sb/3464321/